MGEDKVDSERSDLLREPLRAMTRGKKRTFHEATEVTKEWRQQVNDSRKDELEPLSQEA